LKSLESSMRAQGLTEKGVWRRIPQYLAAIASQKPLCRGQFERIYPRL